MTKTPAESRKLPVNLFEMACICHITNGLWVLEGNNRHRTGPQLRTGRTDRARHPLADRRRVPGCAPQALRRIPGRRCDRWRPCETHVCRPVEGALRKPHRRELHCCGPAPGRTLAPAHPRPVPGNGNHFRHRLRRQARRGGLHGRAQRSWLRRELVRDAGSGRGAGARTRGPQVHCAGRRCGRANGGRGRGQARAVPGAHVARGHPRTRRLRHRPTAFPPHIPVSDILVAGANRKSAGKDGPD